MNYNPFDQKLYNAKSDVSNLSSKRKQLNHQIDWFESTDLDTLEECHKDLQDELKNKSLRRNNYDEDCRTIELDIVSLSSSIKTFWNPKNWFDTVQKALREDRHSKKKLLSSAQNKVKCVNEELHKLKERISSNQDEIKKYTEFNYDAETKNRQTLTKQIFQSKKRVEYLTEKKKQVDLALAPIMKQIREVKQNKSKSETVKNKAQNIANQLSAASSSYDRAMIHQKCEKEFNEGNPRKIISQESAKIRSFERSLEKLNQRALRIAKLTARQIQKLIIDGNNLCYQGDTFVGLNALTEVVPLLADQYDVKLVFDASIRRALESSDSDVRNVFGEDICVHVVATSVKADETVLDLAGADDTAFVVSNDRFAEFGEKAAVKDKRLIRHEIVSGQVFIHDLKLSVDFDMQ